MAATPDGRTVYVGRGGTVIPVRTATNKAGREIKAGGTDALLVGRYGKTLYASPQFHCHRSLTTSTRQTRPQPLIIVCEAGG